MHAYQYDMCSVIFSIRHTLRLVCGYTLLGCCCNFITSPQHADLAKLPLLIKRSTCVSIPPPPPPFSIANEYPDLQV